jgi:hypothetical protein
VLSSAVVTKLFELVLLLWWEAVEEQVDDQTDINQTKDDVDDTQ